MIIVVIAAAVVSASRHYDPAIRRQWAAAEAKRTRTGRKAIDISDDSDLTANANALEFFVANHASKCMVLAEVHAERLVDAKMTANTFRENNVEFQEDLSLLTERVARAASIAHPEGSFLELLETNKRSAVEEYEYLAFIPAKLFEASSRLRHRKTTRRERKRIHTPEEETEITAELIAEKLEVHTADLIEQIADEMFNKRKHVLQSLSLSEDGNLDFNDPLDKYMQIFVRVFSAHKKKLVSQLREEGIGNRDIARALERTSMEFAEFELAEAQNLMIDKLFDETARLLKDRVVPRCTESFKCVRAAVDEGDLTPYAFEAFLAVPMTPSSEFYIETRWSAMMVDLERFWKDFHRAEALDMEFVSNLADEVTDVVEVVDNVVSVLLESRVALLRESKTSVNLLQLEEENAPIDELLKSIENVITENIQVLAEKVIEQFPLMTRGQASRALLAGAEEFAKRKLAIAQEIMISEFLGIVKTKIQAIVAPRCNHDVRCLSAALVAGGLACVDILELLPLPEDARSTEFALEECGRMILTLADSKMSKIRTSDKLIEALSPTSVFTIFNSRH